MCSLLLSLGLMALDLLHGGRPRCSSPHCAGAACAGRVMRCVLEEGGCPPGLELEPQLSKWLWGQYSASSCPRGSSSAVSPTACSTLQQDKRALSPGNSWLSYFSFRPHLLVGAVVISQAGHDIQDAFFRSPRAKPNLPLQLCREKCRGKSGKLGSCWRGTEVCLGNFLLTGSADHPRTGQRFPRSQTCCKGTPVSWTGVFRYSRVLCQDGGRELLTHAENKYNLTSLHAGSAFARA